MVAGNPIDTTWRVRVRVATTRQVRTRCHLERRGHSLVGPNQPGTTHRTSYRYLRLCAVPMDCKMSNANYFGMIRLCLGPHGMQNKKYQLIWNDEIQNTKIFMGVFSSIQNAKFFMGWVRVFWFFGFFFAS
jgi:hypothetical protein